METTAHSLPIEEAFREGWKRTRANLRPLAILGLLNLLLTVAQQPPDQPGQTARPLFILIPQLLQLCVWLVYVRWALALHDGREIGPGFDRSLLRGLVPFVATGLVYGLVVAFGLVLLIVPGVVWGLKYAFATALVVDRDLDPWDALHESARLTRGVKTPLLGFALLCLLLNALGGCLMGVGLIVTLPMTFIAQAHVLRYLQARANGVDVAQPLPSAHVSTPRPA